MKRTLAFIVGAVGYISVRLIGAALGYDPTFGEALVIIIACAVGAIAHETVMSE